MRNLLNAFSQRTLYRLLIAFCAAVSVCGVLAAVFITHNKDDACRGGGFAVIFAFGILFLRRNYGERVYRTIIQMFPSLEAKLENIADGGVEAFSNDELTELLLGILGRINTESDEQRVQNIALFWASFIGTVFWCLGDDFYKWMKLLHF